MKMLRSGGMFLFHCPCELHRPWQVWIDGERAPEGQHTWRWNGSLDAPTFVHAQDDPRTGLPKDGSLMFKRDGLTCHVLVREGSLHFLHDCTHHLRKRVVPLPDRYREKASRNT